MTMQMKEVNAQTGVETTRDFTSQESAASSSTESSVRELRDALLAETDWWSASDLTMTAAQTAYRQALRDVPDQAGFPNTITWPTKP